MTSDRGRAGRLEARLWNRRVDSWHHQVSTSDGFGSLRDVVIERAQPESTDRCVDLGAGTGFLTLALANRVARVLAVDVAPAMLIELEGQVSAGTAVTTQVCDLAALDLPRQSVDLIVSNYALHHLHHQDKRELLARSQTWLAPGGRIVIADMMFGKGTSKEDRTILLAKMKALAAKGPGGWWRIAKNIGRFGLGIGTDRPASPEFWQQALRDAGYRDVTFDRILAESGLVSGHR